MQNFSREQIQKVGVTGAIFNKQKILLMKRSPQEDFLPGNWEMPGGKVAFGETPQQALIREIKEETCLDILAHQPYSVFSYVNAEKQTFDIQFICELQSDPGTLKISHEHIDARWVTRDELDQLQISDMMKASILKGFNQMNR